VAALQALQQQLAQVEQEAVQPAGADEEAFNFFAKVSSGEELEDIAVDTAVDITLDMAVDIAVDACAH
jgi:hypothetical protein